MEIRQLEYFVAIAEMGSFTRAAEVCHVVQTTVSHAIAALERELDAQLFVREGRTVELTAEGRAFLPDARSIVGQARRVERDVRRRRSARRGMLRLGYYGNGLGRDFPEAVRRFCAETGSTVSMCGADAALSRGDLAFDLRHGYIDAFIIAHEPLEEQRSWAEQRVVACNRIYLVAAADDELAACPGSVSRDDLGRIAPSICMFRAAHTDAYVIAMRSWLARDFGVDSSVVSWSDNMEDIRLRTRCGQCRMLAFCNSDAASFAEGDLVYRRIDGMDYLPVTLVWRRDDANGLAARFAEVATGVSIERGIDVGSVAVG